MVLLEESGVDLTGKDVVVVGRSNNRGQARRYLLCMAQNATVQVCHSRTKDLAGHVRAADVVIAAVGRPEMIKGDWIKEGAVVIDIGINRLGRRPTRRRRGVRHCLQASLGDHAGSRRSRSDDDQHAA